MRDVIDQSKIFKVFAGSSELSPFHKCYANEHTILRNCAGRLFPHYNGEDIVSCYWALKKKAILIDVPERPIEVSGQDSVPFLNLIFTREISTLKVNRGCYALACQSDGGLFMDTVIFRLEQNRFWIVHPDGDLSTWLEAHKSSFNVKIHDPESRVLQLQGPNSFEIINRASNGCIGKKFGYFHSRFVNLGDQRLYVSRTGWTGELGYEIYTQGQKTDAVQLWKHLWESAETMELQFSSMQAINIRRIEAGILDSGSDFNMEMNPFEAGLGKFVDLRKNHFIGRTALLTVIRKKKLYGILCKELVPKRGYLVTDSAGLTIGGVTTGALSPYFLSGIGYVKIFNGQNYTKKVTMLKSQSGEQAECKIVELPFYDKEKFIPRNL